MHTSTRIYIDGHVHEVNHHRVSGAHIKALGHHELGLLFRLDGEERHQIHDHETVDLHGGDRFVIVANAAAIRIDIEVDGKAYVVGRRCVTGAEIKALAKRPPGNALYRLEGNQRIPVADNDTVQLHEHERFVTVAPHGHAS